MTGMIWGPTYHNKDWPLCHSSGFLLRINPGSVSYFNLESIYFLAFQRLWRSHVICATELHVNRVFITPCSYLFGPIFFKIMLMLIKRYQLNLLTLHNKTYLKTNYTMHFFPGEVWQNFKSRGKYDRWSLLEMTSKSTSLFCFSILWGH